MFSRINENARYFEGLEAMEILIGIAAIGIILVTLPALLALGGLIIGMLAPVIAVVVVLGVLGTFWNELEPLIAGVLGIALFFGIIGFVGKFILDLLSSPDDTGSSNPDTSALEPEQPDEEVKLNAEGRRIPHLIFVKRLLKEGINSENFDTETWFLKENGDPKYLPKRDVDEMSISEAIEYNKAQEKLADLHKHKETVEHHLTIWNEFLSWAETESEDELRRQVREGHVPPISLHFPCDFYVHILDKAMRSLDMSYDLHKGTTFNLFWSYCPRVENLKRKWENDGLRISAKCVRNHIELKYNET